MPATRAQRRFGQRKAIGVIGDPDRQTQGGLQVHSQPVAMGGSDIGRVQPTRFRRHHPGD